MTTSEMLVQTGWVRLPRPNQWSATGQGLVHTIKPDPDNRNYYTGDIFTRNGKIIAVTGCCASDFLFGDGVEEFLSEISDPQLV